MSVTAKYTIPEEIKNITIRRMIADFDSQMFIFSTDQTEATYEPTLAEWNWFKTGINSKLQSIPRLTDVVVDNYDPDKHLTPGTWHINH